MPFSFTWVCDLLQDVQDGSLKRPSRHIIAEWFANHQKRMESDCDATALLSTLLPERRTDRVYSIGAARLHTIFSRAQSVGISRQPELTRWQTPGMGVDLGDCVEQILNITPNPSCAAEAGVTVEEIDDALHQLAAKNSFSSAAVQKARLPPPTASAEAPLAVFFKLLSPRDAKWLVRLVLKDFTPVELDENAVLRGYHPALPLILRAQADLIHGISFLEQHLSRSPVTRGKLTVDELTRPLQAKVGVKVGRQPFWKARSIHHCFKMVEGGNGRASCQRKMDGEYVQIHVDLSKGYDTIKIFSKSGKESTNDRSGMIDAIRSSLRIGTESCRLRKGCILEGEMVVYSDKDDEILSFNEIRKHVRRSGRLIGTEKDSPPYPWEHLMVVYFDLLLIDEESLLHRTQTDRFRRLKELIIRRKGHAEIVQEQQIDFHARSAAKELRSVFAKCITSRSEGLVLKADDPYFDFSSTKRRWGSSSIKLKKEYIKDFGDVGDFAVIGARYDAVQAKHHSIPDLRWTHFYIGCLENKDAVIRWKRRPRFVVTNVVLPNSTQLHYIRKYVNTQSIDADSGATFDIRFEDGVDDGKRPSIIFAEPPVFDIRCFSFYKQRHTGCWSLRFPQISKIHAERGYWDAITFSELQEFAEESLAPPQPDKDENEEWIKRLMEADPRGIPVDAQTQSTVATTTPSTPVTPSPARRSRNSLPPVPESPLGSFSHPPSSQVCPSPDKTPRRVEPDSPGIHVREVPRVLKRPREELAIKSPRRSKIRRRSNYQSSSPSKSSTPGRSFSQSQSPREPLGDITESSQTRDNTGGINSQRSDVLASFEVTTSTQPLGDGLKIAQPSSSAAASFHTAPTGTLSSPTATMHSSPPPETATLTVAAVSSGRLPANPSRTPILSLACRCGGSECVFTNSRFLLSPCTAKMPWVVEDLIPSHGTIEVITDPQSWKYSSRATLSAAINGKQQQGNADGAPTEARKRRRTKVAFVERRRSDAVTQFFGLIEQAKLTRRNGEREWMEVYDWRYLEALTDSAEEHAKCHDKGDTTLADHMRELQRKHWVGLA